MSKLALEEARFKLKAREFINFYERKRRDNLPFSILNDDIATYLKDIYMMGVLDSVLPAWGGGDSNAIFIKSTNEKVRRDGQTGNDEAEHFRSVEPGDGPQETT